MKNKVDLSKMTTLKYDDILYEGYYIDKEGNIYSKFTDTLLTFIHQKGNTYFTAIHNVLYNNGKNKQIFKNKALRETFGDMFDVENIYKDEEWKNILDDNGQKTQYYISNYGRLYASHQRKIKKHSISVNGYARYRLYYGNNITKNISEHKLVATYFLEQPTISSKNTINHIDGNKLNNYYKNLEYMTNLENMQHSVETGLRRGITKELANKMYNDYCNGMNYEEIGKKYNFDGSNVAKKIKEIIKFTSSDSK